MSVPRTILDQLGGRPFRLMTGARDFIGTADTLTFRLPGGGGFYRGGINRVAIRLTGRDDYTVTFSRVRGHHATTIAEYDMIYADQLQSVFSAATGLHTRLGTMGVRA